MPTTLEKVCRLFVTDIMQAYTAW